MHGLAAGIARCLIAMTALALLVLSGMPLAYGRVDTGVVVALSLAVAAVLLAWRWHAVRHWRQVNTLRRWCWRLLWLGFAAWVLSVAWLWQTIARAGQAPQSTPPVVAIVVLGAGTYNGQPRPSLALRLDTAAQLAALQPKAKLAVSGGVDFGASESEGAIMARYLAQQYGLQPSAMVVEEASTSTELNLALTKPLLQAQGVDLQQPVAIVSNDFHLWRALRIARQQGYAQPIGVAAPTPRISRFTAWLREYFAIASGWVLGEW